MFKLRRFTKRRFRAPVLSRLTLAWIGFICVSASAVVLAFIDTQQRPEQKIAVSYDETIELLTQPKHSKTSRPLIEADIKLSEANVTGRRATTPLTKAGLADQPIPQAPRKKEKFQGFDDDTPFSNEIVITIDGAPAKHPSEHRNNARTGLVQPQAADFKQSSEPVAAPHQSLLRKTSFGAAPQRTKNARPAHAYAKPFAANIDAPKVSIIVGGLGLNKALTEKAINELPAHVTLAFAPYGKDLQYWADKARANGHETVLELPMEAHSANASLGPAALLTSQSPAQNTERLDWLLSRFKGFFAVTNYRGEKFAASTAMTPALIHLSKAGVAYIDDTGLSNPGRIVGPVSRDWLSVDYLLAANATRTDNAILRDGLKALEQKARSSGAALAKTYAHDGNIDELALWAAGLNTRGFVMAPASSLLPRGEGAL